MPRQAPKATNIAAAGETPLTFAEEPPRMPRKAEVVIDRSARGTKRGRASRVISSDEESYEVAAMKRPKASRPVPDEEGVNDDANVAVEIEGDADEGFPIVHSSRRSGMTARPSSTRVRHQSSKAAAAAAASNSPLSDDDASASRPGTSPPPSPKLATKPTRKKVPPKRRSKKETDSESEFDDPDVVPEADLSGLEDVPAPSAASSKSKTRGLVLSGKGRGGTGKKKAAEPNVAVRDESSSGKRAPASVMPPAKRPHAEDDTASPVEQGATEQPLAKKSRLPPIPKKSNIANGTASAGSNTPTNKPNTATAAVLPAGVRRPPPVPGAKKGGDIDLNNLDEYNKLFGIVGSSSTPKSNKPATTSTPTANFRLAEQKAKEIAAKREQARVQRVRDWDPGNCFDLQASGDRIRAYEQKLWSENRYLYISQVASAWIVMAPPPPGMRPHRLAPPRRLSAHATAEEGDRIDVEPSPP